MINTYSGEKIELRVGDVIGYFGDPRQNMVIEAIITNDFLMTDIDIYPAKDCILLHRPFMPGDEVEFYSKGQKKWLVISPLKKRETLNTKRPSLRKQYRHKNPAWRDHPEYHAERGDSVDG